MDDDVIELWIKDVEIKIRELAKSFAQLRNAYEQTKAYQAEQKQRAQAEKDRQFRLAYSTRGKNYESTNRR
jgi:elongation factor P--beta-lysine ligase